MNSRKNRDNRAESCEAPAIDPASADGAVSADPATLQKELAAQKDAHLRLAADFDNFRKRTLRDSSQQAAMEKEAFIRDLLPILDNFERALVSEQSTSSGPLRQGVTMTLQQMGQLLGRHGIEAVEDLGRPFDPRRHDAVFVGYDPNRPDRTILEVIQRGYRRGDTVFRPAKVVVNDLSHPPGVRHAR
ncbi:MAG: nucleotide exchange factor GrpE [Solirubrobacterales bacterium]